MLAVDDNLCLSSLHDEYNILCSVSTPLCDADINKTLGRFTTSVSSC